MLARLLPDSPQGRRRVLLLVAAAATVLRLLYVAEIHDHPYWRTPLVDAADYHGRAVDVMRGKGLGPEAYYKAPAYPFLVGQVYRVAGPRLEAIYALQMLGGVVAAVLTTALGLRWFGPGVAAAGGLFTGLYGPLPYFENQLLIESSALFFSVLAAFLLFHRRPGSGAAWVDALAGVAAGAALQLRPVNVALVAALVAGLGLEPLPWSVRLRRIACVLVPTLLLLVPTMRHNRVATGRFVPISVNGGINFYIGNNPDYDSTVAIRPGLRWEELTARFDSTDDPVRWQENYYRAAYRFAREQPAAYAALLAKKLVLFWNRREIDRNQDSRSMMSASRVLRACSVRWSTFAPLGLVGLVVLARVWRQQPLHALFVLQMLGVVAFFVTSRYRVAVVPWLGLAAGAGLATFADAAVRGARATLRLAAGILAALLVVLPPWYGIGAHDFGRPDFDLAEVLSRRGDRVGALHAYERAAVRHRDDPDVHFRYGEHLARLGRADSALVEYRRAAELAPWSYKPPMAVGAALLEAGDLDGAWAALSEAERRGDPHGRSLYDMGLVRERERRYDDALSLYRQSLERPDTAAERAVRRLGVARVLVLLRRPEEAEVEFEAAARDADDPALVTVERAAAWLRMGESTRALGILQGSPASLGTARAQYLLSLALVATGQRDAAREAARRAASLDATSARYRSWLARIDAAAGLDSAAIDE